MKYLVIYGSVSAVVLTSALAFATTRSHAAFHPASPSDVGQINDNGFYLWNAGSGPASVVADLGLLPNCAGGTSAVTVYGFSQGNTTDTCQLMLTSLTTFTRSIGSQTFGGTPGAFTITVHANNPADSCSTQYEASVYCTLGGLQPNNSGEQIWGTIGSFSD